MTRVITFPILFIAFFLPTTVFGQLKLDPQEIDVNDVSQSRKALLTFEGKPLSRGDILDIVSGVSKSGDAVPENVPGDTHFSNYSFMFDFTVSKDGFITIRPKQGLVEIGSYDLIIRSVHGTVTGVINANLRDSIPARERRPLELSKFRYEITLPDYIYGQRISIELNPDSKNIYYWYIDGDLHSSGPGKTSFQAWPEIGHHEISYIARNPDGHVVSQWSDTTNISEEEAISTTVRKGYEVPFSAPTGYSHVTWRLNDKILAEERLERTSRSTRTIKFRNKGLQTVSCVARGSETGNFRRITWSVMVR